MTSHAPAPRRPPHPFIYLLLILPFGASTGFVTVTLAYQLTQAGVDAATLAATAILVFLGASAATSKRGPVPAT